MELHYRVMSLKCGLSYLSTVVGQPTFQTQYLTECPIMPPSTKATEGLTTPKSQTNEPTISTPELIADESTASEPINEETTIPTEPLSLPASVIAAVVLAMLVVITLIIFAAVLLASAVVVSKKRRSGSSVNLNLGVTNQFPGKSLIIQLISSNL